MDKQTKSKGRNPTSRKRILISLVACFLVLANVISYRSPLRRFLTVSVIEDEQLFQITVTGVPDRVPTLPENMVFEAAVFYYLKEKLAQVGERIYTVRVKPDKTIHYRRSLNEQFSIIGEKFVSNGNIELNQETLDRIDDHNRRILGNEDKDGIIHQISLMVLIKGSHHSSLEIGDYDELILNAINEGQVEIIDALGASSTDYSDKATDYFKDTQSVMCVGVGPRDGESYLKMTNQNPSSIDHDEVVMSKLSQTDNQNMQMDDQGDTKKYYSKGSANNIDETFNADAIEFQYVSSIFFVLICTATGLWYIAKIALKKHEERRQKLTLAKKAYEGPQKDSSALFSNGRYTGTMDTGAGL